jgi:hypothetical protein
MFPNPARSLTYKRHSTKPERLGLCFIRTADLLGGGNYNIYKPRKVNALTIRKSILTNLLKAGNDLRIVQVFAGHKYHREV